MATTRPFGYNTGSAIDGTFQVGNIAVGIIPQTYANGIGGITWWGGPDEDLGYIIAKPDPSGNVTNPIGIPAYISFSRTTELTDESFIDLVNIITNNNFTDANVAKTYLDNNGYWTSWASQELTVDIGSEYESGSTVATYTITTSDNVDTDLTINFTNILYDANGNELPIEVSTVIDAGRNSKTVTITSDYDYNDVQPYQTSIVDITSFGSNTRVSTLNKYSSVNFVGKTQPGLQPYIFENCCDDTDLINIQIPGSPSWITSGYVIFFQGQCYKFRAIGGDGSDGTVYGYDTKTCLGKICPSCETNVTPTPSPTAVLLTPTPTPTVSVSSEVAPSVTPTVTPTISVTPSITISATPSVTPTVSVSSEVAPSVTPTISVTPSITISATPSVTPTITVTPTISATPGLTVTPSPSTSYEKCKFISCCNGPFDFVNVLIPSYLIPSLTSNSTIFYDDECW